MARFHNQSPEFTKIQSCTLNLSPHLEIANGPLRIKYVAALNTLADIAPRLEKPERKSTQKITNQRKIDPGNGYCGLVTINQSPENASRLNKNAFFQKVINHRIKNKFFDFFRWPIDFLHPRKLNFGSSRFRTNVHRNT